MSKKICIRLGDLDTFVAAPEWHLHPQNIERTDRLERAYRSAPPAIQVVRDRASGRVTAVTDGYHRLTALRRIFGPDEPILVEVTER